MKKIYIYNNIIMEYQKIINLLENTPNQPTKFSTKNWVEKNDEQYKSTTMIFKLNLKRQFYGQVYIIIAMHI